MSSLADLPELVGFFSYSREDDADSHGALSTLRNRIQAELRGQLGRTAKSFRLWQDKEAIPAGTLWEAEIKTAVGQSVFFIPIITPTVVASQYCRFELDAFLAREAALGRSELVFPILYIDVPALEDSVRRQNDLALSLIAKRQYVDWREFRHLDINSTEIRKAIGQFCTHIRDALHRPWISPEERAAQEEAAALQRAENERRRQEAETQYQEEEARKRWEAARGREHAAQERRVCEAETPRKNQTESTGIRGFLWTRKHTIAAKVLGLLAITGIGFGYYSGFFDSLANTTWMITSRGSDTCDIPRRFDLRYFHRLNGSLVAGTWGQSGKSVVFDVGDRCSSTGGIYDRPLDHRYTGTFEGDQMSGDATNLKTGSSWKWSGTRNK